MTLQDLADIAGADAVVPLSTVTNIATAKVVFWSVTGGGTVRIGNAATVGASRGLPLVGGSGVLLPYLGQLDWWAVSSLAAYVPTGTTLSLALGV